MEAFRTPNVKGLRFKPNYHDCLTKDTYKKFLEKYPEYGNVTFEQFKSVIKGFNKSLWQTALNERDGIELPQSMGAICIVSCEPTTRENVDFRKSAELGVKVYHRNMNSDGKVAKVFYTNHPSKYNFANKYLWAFKAGRSFARTITKEYPDKWHIFIMKEKFKKGEVFRETVKSNKRKNFIEEQRSQSATEDYNEFNMD